MEYHDNIQTVDLLSSSKPFDFNAIFLEFLNNFTENNIHIYSTIKFHMTIALDHMNIYNQTLFTEFIRNAEEQKINLENLLFEKHQRTVILNFISKQQILPISNISSNYLNKVIRISGICTSIGEKILFPLKLFSICRICNTEHVGDIPRTCIKNCGLDTYIAIPDKCTIIDQQIIKIQEFFTETPVGDIPKTINVLLESNLVNITRPGENIIITGIWKNGIFKVIGFESVKMKEVNFNFNLMKNDILNIFLKHINLFGNEILKKALIYQLVGGTVNSERRDFINILLLGDPGIAKSQLLKQFVKFSPVGFYTSGKGASAAGLTASLLKSSDRYYIEGGALVLANDGLCAIDEFDKMDERDRVAIHEAMEQGTISINKGGLSAVLKSNTAVLAAANPIFGKYDQFKSIGENIDFENSILSRFDLIFILKDSVNKKWDNQLADHLLNIHIKKQKQDYTTEMMQEYIRIARSIKVVLKKEAQEKLKEYFLKQRAVDSPLPITMRQFESLIRLTEARAKLHLREEATGEDAEEAILLFEQSTMAAVKDGLYIEGIGRDEYLKKLEIAKKAIGEQMEVNKEISYEQFINLIKTDDKILIKYLEEKNFILRNGENVVRVN